MSEVHSQTFVKVNAPVDDGVADLVLALSEFPALETIENCQGDGVEPAWVGFWYGNDWRALSEFVLGFLAPNLQSRVGDSADVMIKATEYGRPRGEIVVRPGNMPQIVEVVATLDRNSGYCDGK